MNILFTICGRAGSKGFKNKNLKEMNGVPLVFFTLAVIKLFAQKHPEYNVIIALNTDSEELKKIVLGQRVLEDIMIVNRKEELAGDTSAKVAVIQDTYFTLKDNNCIDLVVDLDITSPLRRVEDVENVIEEYKSNDYDLVYSVVEARRSPYFNMVEKKTNGYYGKICNAQYTARQQAPKSYELNASIYVYSPEFLDSKIEKTILDYKCGIVVMPDFLVLDIDSEEDFLMMEFLHCFYCRKDVGINDVYSFSKLFVNKES